MNRNLKFLVMLLPLLVFFSLGLLFQHGLKIEARKIPSPFIDKITPEFNLPDLNNTSHLLNRKIFLGKISLLNVFASWCSSCRMEHPLLMDIAKSGAVSIYGLNYKDERGEALQFLKVYGNPYHEIGFDKEGQVGIDWGVYGTPETFIIDQQGIIRYKQTGPIDLEIWNNTLLPIIRKLQH